MTRKPYFTLPGIPQYVVQCVYNTESRFYSVDDNSHYLDNLHEVTKYNSVAINADMLMINHMHLLLTHGLAHGLTHLIQDMTYNYVRYINSAYSHSVWEGRYKVSLVYIEAVLLRCMRYKDMEKTVICPQSYKESC